MQMQQQHVMPVMDSVFLLAAADRANFILGLMRSLGCTYICLWSYFSHRNCLLFEDGYYSEETNQDSSSSTGFLAYGLFDEYQHQTIFIVKDDFVPGLAFKLRSPYIELNELDLQRLASVESQRQFYLEMADNVKILLIEYKTYLTPYNIEARIKVAVFMGCRRGEIELGFSALPQINLKMEMKNLFPDDFALQSLPMELPRTSAQDQTGTSSSSSPSIDSSEYTSLLLSLPRSSYLQEQIFCKAPLMIKESRIPISATNSNLATPQPQQQTTTFQAFGQLQQTAFPTPESIDAAMTKAILAVLSAPDPSSSFSLQQTQASAFKRYRKALAPLGRLGAGTVRRLNVIKRLVAFLRSLNYERLQQQEAQGSHAAASTRLHHMISERRRRMKINESIQALRSLLPLGTKKHQASVLKSTAEYLSTLKYQIAELSRRNQHLEEQLLSVKKNNDHDHDEDGPAAGSGASRPNVRLIPVAESTSDQQLVDLQVNSVGDSLMLAELIIQILEFLKQVRDVKLVSMEAQTHRPGQNRLIMRLSIDQESNWCESAFQEAIQRIVLQFQR